jgi:uncharacterized glyoxalase superfamily protein PhnB
MRKELRSVMNNRSIPTNIVLVHFIYQNLPDAIDWLTRTFGFSEHYRYGEPIAGAQMHLGDAWIQLGSSRPGRVIPPQQSVFTATLTVFVEDVDAHYTRAKSLGARILEDLHETVYGERQYGVEDLDGHHWLFSQHARDLSPDEWGATIAQEFCKHEELK